MASRSHAQAKLNTVVEVIGEGLDSEVCSIYLLREGMLELFATKGLAQEAVHVTRMGIGEGLVGTIADNIETLNLAEATAHPDFSYRPETGEEKFHSFAGVPIVRRERAVGVLCVQHVDPRRYEEVEIEALQTVAMVLSELIANAGLVDDEQVALSPRQQTGPVRLSGLALVKGWRRGVAVYHQPRVTIEHVVAEDTEAERQRVYLAFDKMREQIDRMASQAEFGVGGEHEEVLETYKMFAYDEGWSAPDQRGDRLWADRRGGDRAGPAAHPDADAPDRRSAAGDRMHDLEDLSNRLLRIVSGQMGTAASQGPCAAIRS
jgi:phosphotransferase system enzyme I (PtsP)